MDTPAISETEPPILEVEGLKTIFHTQEGTIHAVNGVSFHLRAGELVGIVGESGSGKSVTMMSLMKLLPEPPAEIVSGTVRLEGRDLLQLEAGDLRRVRGAEVGFVFQDPMTSLNPVFTIGFQLSEPLREHLGLSKKAARARAIELLHLVGIPSPEDRFNDFPHQFSGGMRQRVMIAIALSCDPKVLIADEPTTALDVTIQAQILELVKKLRQELGMGIIWITHDLGVVAGIADRVMVMYGGLVVEHARVADLYARPLHPYMSQERTASAEEIGFLQKDEQFPEAPIRKVGTGERKEVFTRKWSPGRHNENQHRPGGGKTSYRTIPTKDSDDL